MTEQVDENRIAVKEQDAPIEGQLVSEHDSGGYSKPKVVREQMFWSGPLPTPETFEMYGNVLADAPDRIIRMAEKEQVMRQEANQIALSNDRLRIYGSIGVSLALIVAAVLTAYFGYPWVSIPLGLAGIGSGLLRAFMSRRESDG